MLTQRPQIVMTSFLETIHLYTLCKLLLLARIGQWVANSVNVRLIFVFSHFILYISWLESRATLGMLGQRSKCQNASNLDRGPNITMLSEPLVNECFLNIPYQYICLNIWHKTTGISKPPINYSIISVRIVESHRYTVIIFLLFSNQPISPLFSCCNLKLFLCEFPLGV